MARNDFLIPESQEVWRHLEVAALRSHRDAGRVFDDFLSVTVCALSGGQMEDQYLEIVKSYNGTKKSQRAVDTFPIAFAELVYAMEKTRRDILGDIFQGAITHGGNGQFFTPESVCELMACMTTDPEAKSVIDPSCGSGRLLLASAEANPYAELLGWDIDPRCVRMTAINLALRNRYGWAVHGNSLTEEKWQIYRTGFNGRGVIAEVALPKCPEPVKRIVRQIQEVRYTGRQLSLF